MRRLILRHLGGEETWTFEVQRIDANGAKPAPPAIVEDPLTLALPGTAQPLGTELAWYLEHYLDYPYAGNTIRAERVQSALRGWGERAFDALLGHGRARDFYNDATRDGHTALHLMIASNDPRVLSWPWEALCDPQIGDLAHHCRIERQIDSVRDPLPLPEGLSRERVNILLVTARPHRNDIAYRSISRPLVELIHSENLPAAVKVLRPPTFENLRRELQAHPGQYHIVHFDGHGGFGPPGVSGVGGADRFEGSQGYLQFERDDGEPDPVTANQLSQLLREHRIPIAVLNACQSAMLSEQVDSVFASVATALLKAGVRSVVAMGYSLYVSAARQFLPAFYLELFRSGSVAEAVRGGRQAMLARPQRRGEIKLDDWLVPVLYQQDPLALTFAAQARIESTDWNAGIPEEAQVEPGQAPHGVIGRDSAVLELERASRAAPPALLLHGLGGVGKTTLARGYLQWLAHTQGMPAKVIWQNLSDVRSFDYLRNRLVEELFGTDAMALPDGEKWKNLQETLRRQTLLVVWDNFESASGSADAGGADEAMPAADRQALKQFLVKLRGGKSKVLITSRSDEQWLSTELCRHLRLDGLQGEERQALAQAILADQGLRLDAKDQDTADLIDSLHGHPLMMRAILPRLGGRGARQLSQELEQYLPQQGSDDAVEQRLYATLRYVEEGMPQGLRPLLLPIGLHERYVHSDFLSNMAEVAQQPYVAWQTRQALELLESAGLVQGLGDNIYEMHPAFERYARTQGARLVVSGQHREAWQHAFTDFMGTLADSYTSRPVQEQLPVFHYFGGSFERAFRMAEHREDLQNSGALIQAMATYAMNRRNLQLAAARFEAFATICQRLDHEGLAAASYHQLGRVAEARRDFVTAESWYRRSLEIDERRDNAFGMAITSQQLGSVAKLRCDFEAADTWYRKALAIAQQRGDEQSAAASYHQLGSIAKERRDFAAAENYYRKVLEIKHRLNDEYGMGMVHYQLGMLAEERRDFDTAKAEYHKALQIEEREGLMEHSAALIYHQLGTVALEQYDLETADAWYRKSIAIKERQDNEFSAALTYHQLGRVAEERSDYAAAEAWYCKSIAIAERQSNERGAAKSYCHLGAVAQAQRDFATAETRYRKALEIEQRQGNEDGAAIACHQLGQLAEQRRDFDLAETWLRRSLAIYERQRNEQGAVPIYQRLGRMAQARRQFDAAVAWYRKALQIAERQGDEHAVALACNQLGQVAQEQGDFATAEAWYRKALEINLRLGNPRSAAGAYHQFGMMAEERRDFVAAEAWYRKSLDVSERLRYPHGAANSYHQLGGLAERQRHFEAARAWYLKAAAVFEELEDDARLAIARQSLQRVQMPGSDGARR
ncbi:Tfp pilus assembly protein PilF [Tahibacter aquaticus]|uniref:Tfp pilus assembly protein PilF n=1 Tax=Tahibacter aquaticus TaxID=520092 RepID=A0A4R6Z509_9GAMM|nr:tetratricopeptide repeat protein [Tahibacter aquaticus]TDR46724.1 Tfp pilus assembly protein PilF [Tahibacter aquaticus]